MKKINKAFRKMSNGFTVVETIVAMVIVSYITVLCISMYFLFTFFGKYI